MSKRIEIAGQKFGRWTAIEYVSLQPKTRRAVWRCVCLCGNEGYVSSQDLRDGHSSSCGCFNRDVVSARSVKADSGINKLMRQYKSSAKYRRLLFALSMEDFRAITQLNCHYCGKPPAQSAVKLSLEGRYIHNGIDRKDNSKGYTLDNCVPCCSACNFLKGSRSYTTFISQVLAIGEHLCR